MVFVFVCCLLVVCAVRSSFFVVRRLRFVVCCVLFGVWCFVLFFVMLWSADCCVSFDWCRLVDARRSLLVVC